MTNERTSMTKRRRTLTTSVRTLMSSVRTSMPSVRTFMPSVCVCVMPSVRMSCLVYRHTSMPSVRAFMPSVRTFAKFAGAKRAGVHGICCQILGYKNHTTSRQKMPCAALSPNFVFRNLNFNKKCVYNSINTLYILNSWE
jgi:hypothetical protein